MKKFPEVPVEKLRWQCDSKNLGFQTTEDIEACQDIIGQERAIRAIRMGLEMKSFGYNIYVSGLSGTGKTTTVKHLLEQLDTRRGKVPNDLCFVHNFSNPNSPRLLELPAGKGKQLAQDIDQMIDYLRHNIPLIYESEEYAQRKKRLFERFQSEIKKVFQGFEERVRRENLALVQVQVGPFTRPEVVPLVQGQPIPWEKLEEMARQGVIPPDTVARLREKHDAFMEELEDIFQANRERERKAQEEVLKLERELVLPLIRAHITELKHRYPIEKVHRYLDEVQESLLQRLDLFKVPKDQEGRKGAGGPKPPARENQGVAAWSPPPPSLTDPFLDYRVNVIVDNSETQGTPIIIETAPSYKNLFGTIEHSMDPRGVWRTDFTRIKAGSLVRANGGYLVFNLLDALAEPGVWIALKRALKNREVVIQSYEPLSIFSLSALKPEPIPIDVKVVVIGDERTYRLLYNMDDEFRKIFKIRADFDTVMTKNEESIKQYAMFVKKICSDENLRPFDSSGVAAVIEYGVKLAGRQNKLSTRFSDVADIIREAHYWAGQDNSSTVRRKHVEKAIRERVYRLRQIEEKVQEMIAEGTILIDTEGSKVGQVNGLSIFDLGDYSFGRPSRITAEVALGQSGIINIEREAELSGKIYNKGVLIIAGYFRGKYAQDKPLAMSASLCFEQSYTGVDGDSASSAEIYAILSRLSGLPLRQDIAVTGSVNQKGEIQPIGGVNEKIEGFFDVCKAKGLTGTQGVIIPAQNVEDLMLREDVVEAVQKGLFHIYPIRTIDEGIEILTGVEAGKPDKKGQYPKGTVHYLVNQKLQEFAERLKGYYGGSTEEED